MGTSSSTHHQTSSSGQGASESLNTNPAAQTDSPQTQATPTPPCTMLDPATPVRPQRAASSAISYADMHRGHASFGEMGSRARQALAMVARGEAKTRLHLVHVKLGDHEEMARCRCGLPTLPPRAAGHVRTRLVAQPFVHNAAALADRHLPAHHGISERRRGQL